MPGIHLIIKGKVQGVFYRATAKDIADKLGIKGWVKNNPEGHVEILATGTEMQFEKFIQWCKQGPPKAVVTDVVVKPIEEQLFDSFKIMRG